MNTKYVDLFVEYLQNGCGYPKCAIRSNNYKYDGKEYERVEVLFGGYIIQAFVLMSAEHCQRLDKFPFYRTYNQWDDKGKLTPPACNVAVNVSGTKEWEIHSSSNLRYEITAPDFLDYSAAVSRFQKRLHFLGNERLMKMVSRLSNLSLSIVFLYITAHILSFNEFLCGVIIPLNAEVVSIIILLVILVLLPPLIPYIKFSYNGLGLEVNQDATYY